MDDQTIEPGTQAGRPPPGRGWRPVVRLALAALGVFLLVAVVWWAVGRLGADDRRLEIRRTDIAADPGPAVDPSVLADTLTELRILTWNVAHGRGAAASGVFANWKGGGRQAREARLDSIGRVLRGLDAHVVILNEVDFRASWSRGVNQAAVLSRTAGYPIRVEQRNYDLRLPFAVFAFGNAVLSRLPVEEARWVDIPPHSGLEAALLGAKSASVVRLDAGSDGVSVVPIHLDPRSGDTRVAAVPVLKKLRAVEEPPLVLAGDFNAAPPGWAPEREADSTVVGELLEAGWRSPRASGERSPRELTYPVLDKSRALDWILVEPPLRVREARVLSGTEELSDHEAVHAVIRLSAPTAPPTSAPTAPWAPEATDTAAPAAGAAAGGGSPQ